MPFTVNVTYIRWFRVRCWRWAKSERDQGAVSYWTVMFFVSLFRHAPRGPQKYQNVQWTHAPLSELQPVRPPTFYYFPQTRFVTWSLLTFESSVLIVQFLTDPCLLVDLSCEKMDITTRSGVTRNTNKRPMIASQDAMKKMDRLLAHQRLCSCSLSSKHMFLLS